MRLINNLLEDRRVNPKDLNKLLVLLVNDASWAHIASELHMHKQTLFMQLYKHKLVSLELAEKCREYVKSKKPTYEKFYKKFGDAGISSLLGYKYAKSRVFNAKFQKECLRLRGSEDNPKMSVCEIAAKLGTYRQMVQNCLRERNTFKRLTPITKHRANTTKEIVKKMYEQGVAAPDIARAIGQTARSVYYYLDQLGLKVKPAFSSTLELPAYYAIKALREKKVKWTVIAKIFNCSSSQIQYFFNNIQTIHPEITQEANVNG